MVYVQAVSSQSRDINTVIFIQVLHQIIQK